MIGNLLNIFKKSNKNKLSKKVVFTGLIFLFLGLFLIESKTNILTTAIRGNNPTEEIRKVTIESSDYPNPGSYTIDKSAKWIDANKAEVEFDVSTKMKAINENNKDIILIIDTSGSMNGTKLARAKSDAIELATHILSGSNNKVALISFDTTSTIVSGFTNNLTTIETGINNLQATGATNYNAGLTNVFTVMDSYQHSPNRDLVTLFLTDGYPNKETPNQKGTYRALKESYPYMTINGIQYEMGKSVIQEIIDISDNQWVADKDTLNNILFDTTIAPLVYETFTIEDYIDNDYFELASVNDIEVSKGTVTLDNSGTNQKVIWTIENLLMTGESAKLTMNLNLKSAHQNTSGYFPTNESETINTKIPNETLKTQNSNKTPVLKNGYKIIYDTNSPNSNCVLPTYNDETYSVFQTVEKKDTELTCDGYIFRGWEIDEEDDSDLEHLNDDYFLMPYHDITIRATWTTLGISKRMDGTVYETPTLYKVLKDAATEGTYAKEYVGSHQDSMAGVGTEKIYHFWADNDTDGAAILDKNNVIFGGFCWQILRTTDTGGVKLIYNGEPENGQCLNTRSDHMGIQTGVGYNVSLNGFYLYGDSYDYDTVNQTFTIKDNLTTERWSGSTFINLLGKYTCASINDTCTQLYLITGYYSSSNAIVNSFIVDDTHYSEIGRIPFNSYSILGAVGYMNTGNEMLSGASDDLIESETILSSSSLGTNYWYANDIVWGSPTADKYNLDNPYKVSSTSDYPNLVGKYTFRNTSQTYTYTRVYYISAVNNTTMYYIQLGNETGTTHDLSYYNYTYTYGDSYTDNGDGTYTINNPTTINRSDWYTSYNNVKNKYVCKNATNNTCSVIRYVSSTSATEMEFYSSAKTYKYAKGFTYENRTYKLNDESVTFWNLGDSTNRMSLNNAHYTCFNETGECTGISYIYSMEGPNSFYQYKLYFVGLLEGGQIADDIEDLLNDDLFSENANRSSSLVKDSIDLWYEKYMTPYDNYIEDTIFCNDRSVRNLGGWNPDGGDLTQFLTFKEYIPTTDLSCTNVTDRLSVSNEDAQLKYKVGLATSPEMNLLNRDIIRATGHDYLLGSPSHFGGDSGNFSNMQTILYDGAFFTRTVESPIGVRPVISLVPEIKCASGDGSQANPYIVDTQ